MNLKLIEELGLMTSATKSLTAKTNVLIDEHLELKRKAALLFGDVVKERKRAEKAETERDTALAEVERLRGETK